MLFIKVQLSTEIAIFFKLADELNAELLTFFLINAEHFETIETLRKQRLRKLVLVIPHVV